MKIHICYEFNEQHGGGGTSVIENLRKYFATNDLYTDDPADADIILFNSFQGIDAVIDLKSQYPDKIFIHRVDGPMGIYNSPLDLRDEYVFLLNDYIADATIFQTEWSKKACEILGINPKNQPHITIKNAPDSEIFKVIERSYNQSEKFKIFYSSWSTNINKGFDTLHWVDQNLDWNHYEFNFAGRTEEPFKNINCLGKLSKQELSKQLATSHAFLFASKFDPCSNSLAEAIATGIPIISYYGGGSPELLPKHAFTYKEDEEIIDILQNLKDNYTEITNSISIDYNYSHMMNAYNDFIKKCHSSIPKTKKLTVPKKLGLKVKILTIKILSKFSHTAKLYGVLSGKYQLKLDVQQKNRLILND